MEIAAEGFAGGLGEGGVGGLAEGVKVEEVGAVGQDGIGGEAEFDLDMGEELVDGVVHSIDLIGRRGPGRGFYPRGAIILYGVGMNITHLPANLSRTLSDRAQREHRSVEQIAIEALERGLSAGEALSDEDALWSENPQFDEAIQAFAAMEGE